MAHVRPFIIQIKVFAWKVDADIHFVDSLFVAVSLVTIHSNGDVFDVVEVLDEFLSFFKGIA